MSYYCCLRKGHGNNSVITLEPPPLLQTESTASLHSIGAQTKTVAKIIDLLSASKSACMDKN